MGRTACVVSSKVMVSLRKLTRLRTKFFTQQLIHHSRIGFAPTCSHHLADKESEEFIFPFAKLLCLCRIGLDNLIHHLFYGTSITHLHQPLLLNDAVCAFAALPHQIKHLLPN